MSYLGYILGGLLIWYYTKASKPLAPVVPVPPLIPLEVGSAPVTAKVSRSRGFELLLELQDTLLAQGVPQAQVDAIVTPIAPLLLSRKETVA